MNLRPLILCVAACAARPPSQMSNLTMPVAIVVPCASPRAFGAIPDDDVDDRIALQQMLDSCAGTVIDLEAGVYKISTPPFPRIRPMLMARGGPDDKHPTVLRGVDASTELAFDGDNMLGEWRGLQLASHLKILHIWFTSNLANTVEQTHMMRGDGALVDLEIGYVKCFHPSRGWKSGDCIQFVGYPPAADGTNDKRIWDVVVHHTVFAESGRSGIAFHSGMHGTMKGGHYTTRFHHNICQRISDQCIDGEVGTGDGDDDGMEIDHNVFEPRTNAESSVAIQIQGARHVWVHDNTMAGSMDLYGCDACEFSDNTASLAFSDGNPVVLYRKAGTGTAFRDETYTREASAGPGYVMAVAQKLTAPDRVTVDDVKLVQHAPSAAFYAWGIVGLTMRHLTVLADSAVPIRADAVQVSGSSGIDGIRTTEISLSDSHLTGPYLSGIAVGGSYAGTGSLTVERNWSSGTARGLRCDNPTIGSGVTGPVVYRANAMPSATCAPLVP